MFVADSVLLSPRISEQEAAMSYDCKVKVCYSEMGMLGDGLKRSKASLCFRAAQSVRVTTECKMETTMRDDGQVVNVIDTPGSYCFTSMGCTCCSSKLGVREYKCVSVDALVTEMLKVACARYLIFSGHTTTLGRR
ncbi:hypothetical protein MKW98_025268 [Papaver atlanticum]|uniref:Uncharacterized protein n=1 Tax=Papaver atlanticum TaxID=357466 RepID=A0AAD4S1R5_9MAGN|nr:hypothetical protein MKW98_025268 [Papaver atlanticum]